MITLKDIREFVTETDASHPLALAWDQMLWDADHARGCQYYPLALYQEEAEEEQVEHMSEMEWCLYLEWVEEKGGWPDAAQA